MVSPEMVFYLRKFCSDNILITFEIKFLFDRTRCPSVVTYTYLVNLTTFTNYIVMFNC